MKNIHIEVLYDNRKRKVKLKKTDLIDILNKYNARYSDVKKGEKLIRHLQNKKEEYI